MDSRISTASRPDIVTIQSAPRPTPTPVRVNFKQVLASGAGGLLEGAEIMAGALPGSAIAAAAVRGGTTFMSAPIASVGGAVAAAPEGPGAASAGSSPAVSAGIASAIGTMATVPGATDAAGGIDASLQQSAQLSMYYLQIQQQVDAENRSFTAMSNVLKTEHDSAKSAIQNIHS
jgi:hypothetical protein